MLDERQLKVCELLAIGTPAIEIAKVIGISRTSVYDWKKTDEMKARLEELEQDFISSTKRAVVGYGPKAVELLKYLAEHADSEKVRLDATCKLIDKVVSNATRIEIDDNRDSDVVSIDVLDQEISEFDSE
jgi:transposase